MRSRAPQATVVAAGCGDFLVADLLTATPLNAAKRIDYGRDLARVAPRAGPDVAGWARVCAPSVAVASLADRMLR